MTRPRRVLTVVVERCAECQWCHWSTCAHPSIKHEVRPVNEAEPPPEWCPLPKEEP